VFASVSLPLPRALLHMYCLHQQRVGKDMGVCIRVAECAQDPSTGVAEIAFPKKIKGTRDFKFLDDELQVRTALCINIVTQVQGCIRGCLCDSVTQLWQHMTGARFGA